MIKDLKKSLDKLALELQKKIIGTQEKIGKALFMGEQMYSPSRDGKLSAEIKDIGYILKILNKCFGTDYETNSQKLKNYFEESNEPCERNL